MEFIREEALALCSGSSDSTETLITTGYLQNEFENQKKQSKKAYKPSISMLIISLKYNNNNNNNQPENARGEGTLGRAEWGSRRFRMRGQPRRRVPEGGGADCCPGGGGGGDHCCGDRKALWRWGAR